MSVTASPGNTTEALVDAGRLQLVLLPAETNFGSLGKQQLNQMSSTVDFHNCITIAT